MSLFQPWHSRLFRFLADSGQLGSYFSITLPCWQPVIGRTDPDLCIHFVASKPSVTAHCAHKTEPSQDTRWGIPCLSCTEGRATAYSAITWRPGDAIKCCLRLHSTSVQPAVIMPGLWR